MITIITGVPGMGKTAMLVHLLLKNEKLNFSSRPVFVMGVNNLLLDHAKAPPVDEWTEKRASEEDPSLMLDYYTFPPNSILVVDEAQRVFRSRSSGSKVPNHVMALETHRHTGLDIILLTQKPLLLDSNARALCGRHIHIKNTILGRKLFEWFEFTDVESTSNLDRATKRKYSPPKEVFALYKSAEIHTKQPRRLHQIWIYFGLALLALAYLGNKIYNKVQEKIYNKPSVDQIVTQTKPSTNFLNASIDTSIPKKDLNKPTLQPAVFQPTKIEPTHPYIGFNFTILGTATDFKGKRHVYYRLDNQNASLDLSSDDLIKLGYAINSPNECSSFLFFEGAQIVATCQKMGEWRTTSQLLGAVPSPLVNGIIKGETLNGGMDVPPNSVGLHSQSSPNNAPAT